MFRRARVHARACNRANMEWQFWVIMLSILLLSFVMLCGVVCCAMRCFYAKGSREPKVLCCPKNAMFKDASGRPVDESELSLKKNGELAWRESGPPREMNNA